MGRRLSAIFAADMVGYSRLMEADETGTLNRQKAHRQELINPAVAEFHGRIVKEIGDGILVEFPSVVEAVQCAVKIQRTMPQREADLPQDRQIVYRIGINMGDIVVESNDIYGDGVNVAARLEALAEPGGICISGMAYDQIDGRDEFDCVFLGEQTLKNISRPIRIYRVVVSERGTKEASVQLKPALPDKASIAVLPFNNLSGDPDQEYFSDGMTEDLITALSKISWLFVIARNS
jgi:adenylate cyclase